MGHTNGLNVAGCRLSSWELAAHKLWQARLLRQSNDVCGRQRERGAVGEKWQRREGSSAGATWIGCALLALLQIKSLKQRSSASAHTLTHTHTFTHTHTNTHTQSHSLSHIHTYVAHSSMHMHIKAAPGVCVILCIRSLCSVRSLAFVFTIRRRRRKANEYALYLLNKRPF